MIPWSVGKWHSTQTHIRNRPTNKPSERPNKWNWIEMVWFGVGRERNWWINYSNSRWKLCERNIQRIVWKLYIQYNIHITIKDKENLGRKRRILTREILKNGKMFTNIKQRRAVFLLWFWEIYFDHLSFLFTNFGIVIKMY